MRNLSIFFVSLFMVLTLNSFAQTYQVRPNLYDFTPAQRTTLVNLMQQYITAEVVEYHCDFRDLTNVNSLQIHDDFNFLPFHRAYMEGMEDFLILNGHPEFVPLPYFDPAHPFPLDTPSEFQVVDADCWNTDCDIMVSGNANNYCDTNIDWSPEIDQHGLEPNGQFIYPELQDLCDHNYTPPSPPPVPYNGGENQLSRKLETPYHNDVHEEMDGVIFSYASPAAPIFWNWHAYLDDMWKDWECNCPQSTVADVDLYLKDNAELMLHTRDVGEEPNIGEIWESEDIWVRLQQDGFTNGTNQVTEYTGSSNSVYVYVRVRNRGCIPSLGTETLSLHWSKGETSLTWPGYWNGSVSNGYTVMGNTIGTLTIPVIAAQSSKILEFQWTPPNPDDYSGNSDPSHFCLLARQVSLNDPMAEAEVSDVEDNIDDNNNIAAKDIVVVNNAPLPVELTSFTGKRIGEENQLTWYTSSENQNKGFEIHRSTDASSWDRIGWVDGNGTSTQQHFYNFDDKQPKGGINYYRLKQIDFDGGYGFSDVVAIENEKSDFDIRVFPNPTRRNFNIQVKNPLGQKMKIQIHNNLGMRVWESNLITNEPNWNKELQLEKNGIYLITFQIGNEIHFERVVIMGNN